MNIFVAASYSTQVNYETGEVFPEYKEWLEENLATIEGLGHTVFCALRADQYKINNADPAEAFRLDIEQIKKSDILLALVDAKISAGVQTELGYALALGKQVFIGHSSDIELAWFNQAIISADQAKAVLLPITSDSFTAK